MSSIFVLRLSLFCDHVILSSQRKCHPSPRKAGLRKKHTTHGEMGLIHGNRDRRPQHRIGEEIRLDVLRLYRDKYHDFNFSHFADSLKEAERSQCAVPSNATKENEGEPAKTHTTAPNHP